MLAAIKATLALIVAAVVSPAHGGEAVARPTLKLATWNLEWLIAPEAFKPLKASCTSKDKPAHATLRSVPCDVAYELERGTRDFHALARYAGRLDADVIALQEVDGPAAARLVFSGYEFCFTSRAQVQNNGFAIRAGLPHRCGSDLKSLSLGDRLRRGAEVVLFPGEPRELILLSIHLKSGCSTALLDSGEKACAELVRQIPALESWIDARAREGKRFAVLGDFNRDLLDEIGPARATSGRILRIWPELDDADPPESDLRNAAEHEAFRNCVPGQAYTAYIDSIVLSRSLGARLVPGSFERITYSALDARRTKLSDHCPVAVQIGLQSP